jgi:hypothetical protein
MKHLLLSALLLLSLSGCRKDDPEVEVRSEYDDWYALRAPDARAIRAAYGDIDGTLIITTGFSIYHTTDRGKTWVTSNYQDGLGIFGFVQRQDTLLALTAQVGTALETTTAYAASPSSYSIDKGLHWQPYRNWTRLDNFEPRVARNRLKTPSGEEYSIQVRLTPTSPGSSSAYVETIGIKTSTGRQLSLPKNHQIESLYFDTKSRLYVSASAAICGTLQDFAFCGTQNGVLYVSKKSQL